MFHELPCYQGVDLRGPCACFTAASPSTVREALLRLGLSKASVGRLFAAQKVRASMDGPVLRPSDVLEVSSPFLVSLGCGDPWRVAGTHGALPLPSVLYEDDFLLALDKPAPLLVHGDGTGAPTLTDLAARYLVGAPIPQALQRLDVDTTGVVLFSKLSEFQSAFDALVSGGSIEKRYLAVVKGVFPKGKTLIDASLGRDRHDARRMRVAPQGGQPSRTWVECLAVAHDNSVSLVSAVLETGRRHQIRVHLASRGHPVMNDPLYGNGEGRSGALMLHAYRERFRHPVTGVVVDVATGWPERFSSWFDPIDADAF